MKDLQAREGQVDRHCGRRSVARSSRAGSLHQSGAWEQRHHGDVHRFAGAEARRSVWPICRRWCSDLNAGQVDLLLILGGNPVYNAPRRTEPARRHSDGEDARAAGPVRRRDLGSLPVEHSGSALLRTLERCPGVRRHDVDHPAADRAAVWRQIGARYSDGLHRTAGEMPLTTSFATTGRPSRAAADFDTWWNHSVHDGFIKDSALRAEVRDRETDSGTAAAPHPAASGYEFPSIAIPTFSTDATRITAGCRNCRDPITRLTWDNAVVISEKTAKALDVTDEDRWRSQSTAIRCGARSGALPGQPDDSIAVTLGFGRRRSGRAGNGAGFNATRCAPRQRPYFVPGATVTQAGREVPPRRRAASLHHGRAQHGACRHARRVQEEPEFLAEEQGETPPKGLTIYPETWKYEGYAWGMAIDLTSLHRLQRLRGGLPGGEQHPVVGKEQVLNTREMHWIRIDRYYKGERTIRRRTSSRWPACIARTRPANWSARWRRRYTIRKG